MATRDPLDGAEPSSNVGGRPPALKPEHIAVLHDIVTERAQASLKEIADELYRPVGYACAMQRFVVRCVRKASYGSSQCAGRTWNEPRAPSDMATRQPTDAMTYRRTVPI